MPNDFTSHDYTPYARLHPLVPFNPQSIVPQQVKVTSQQSPKSDAEKATQEFEKWFKERIGSDSVKNKDTFESTDNTLTKANITLNDLAKGSVFNKDV